MPHWMIHVLLFLSGMGLLAVVLYVGHVLGEISAAIEEEDARRREMDRW